MRLRVAERTTAAGGGIADRLQFGSDEDAGSDGGADGKQGKQGGNGDIPRTGGIQMPRIVAVRRIDYEKCGFDDHSACKAVDDGTGGADSLQSDYTFYVNVDNVYLRTEMKGTADDAALTEAKFKYANVLVALALLHDRQSQRGVKSGANGEMEEDGVPAEQIIENTTRALAPFIVPMVNYLGALSPDAVAGLAAAGDDE